MSTNRNVNGTEDVRGRTIFCHFSFRRPKEQGAYGIFAVAFYNDFEGKKLIYHKTRKYDLWQDHQFVTAIQSYEHALLSIYELQGQMREVNINQVMLVTDNSTLAGWIENPKKNKSYSAYMDRAVRPYRVGSYKEIVIGVGLCEPRKSEKSYKYCKDELVENNYVEIKNRKENADGYKIDIREYRSALDLIAEDKSAPIIIGIKPIEQ